MFKAKCLKAAFVRNYQNIMCCWNVSTQLHEFLILCNICRRRGIIFHMQEIPMSTVLMEKLKNVKLVKEFPAFYANLNLQVCLNVISFLKIHDLMIVDLSIRRGPGVSVREHLAPRNQIF